MTGLIGDPQVRWALLLIVVVPLAMLAAAEIEERLRQRESELEVIPSLLRRWVLPVLTVWAVAVGVLDLADTTLTVRLTATAALLVVAALAIAAVRLVAMRSRRRVAQGGRAAPQLLLALPRVLVIVTAGWLLLDAVWGVDLSAALTALGVTSLVVSLALQDTLSGLASGLLLLGDSPFQPGEWIRCGELEGRVVDVNWRSVRIETRDGDLMIVPNAQLSTATVVNFDRPTRAHRVVVPVVVAYSNPPTKAKAMLLDAARRTPGVRTDPAPNAFVVQVDDPLMGYEVHLWIDDYRIAPRVKSDFGGLVWYASQRHDVPLPSPAYDLFVYDGQATAADAGVDPEELTERLRVSPLLAELDDDELAGLGNAASARWFAAGEIVSTSTRAQSDLRVLWRGRARLLAVAPGGQEIEVTELGPGDLLGLVDEGGNRATHTLVAAVTDCEVVVVPADAAGEAIGRAPAVAAAVQQIGASRRRRIERLATVTDGHRAPDGQLPTTSAAGRR